MKNILPLLVFCCCSFFAHAQLNMEFVSQLNYTQTINDVWGYAAPDGTEYALVGTNTGTSIVSLADPANPVEVAFVPGLNTTWRDLKTWENFAYVTCDSCEDEGLAVIDLSDLPNAIDYYFLTELPIDSVSALGSCHNIFIDEFGYAYLAGCSGLNNGGVIYLDCATDPANPTFAGLCDDTYSHDVYARDNILYSSEVFEGVFTIFDVSDKDTIIELGSKSTPFDFTHNTWLSDDGNTLFTTDEQANAPVAAYDVSDPEDIQFLDQYVPFETLGDGVIPHNVHVWQNWLIVSYYTDGCIIIDATYPDNLIEVGNFDSFLPAATGFFGVWGAYPYLPSGLVLITDRGNGLFVLEPNYVQAAYLEGKVTDLISGVNLVNATIEILSTTTFASTDGIGEFKSGIATAGQYLLQVSKAGYFPAFIPVDMTNGVITTVDVELIPTDPFPLTGTIINANTNQPIPNSRVTIHNPTFSYEAVADLNGVFEIPSMFIDHYDVYAGVWGYRTTVVEEQFLSPNNNTITVALEEGLEDIFAVDLGWQVTTNTISAIGAWERGIPVSNVLSGFNTVPQQDIQLDEGNFCYLTGNSSNSDLAFLSGATTWLNSPSFDLSGFTEPLINFHHWFLNLSEEDETLGNSLFTVRLNNGIEEVIVYEASSQNDFDNLMWTDTVSINVEEFLKATDNMIFSVEVSSEASPFVTEAAFDYWWVSEGFTISSIAEINGSELRMEAYPNPSTTSFQLKYDFEEWNSKSDYQLVVTNTFGQIVETISVSASNGILTFGENLPTGLYFVQMRNQKDKGQILKVIKQ